MGSREHKREQCSYVWSWGVSALLITLTILLSPAVLLAYDNVNVLGYSVQYLGSTYNGSTTTFRYRIRHVSASQDLSHSTFGFGSCGCSRLVSSDPSNDTTCGLDPTTGVDGLKWDITVGSGQTKYYEYTLLGYVPVGHSDVAVKVGTQTATRQITGPDCVTPPVQCKDAFTLRFDNFPTGTILESQLRDSFYGLEVQTHNNRASGPDKAIIFDTAAPTGEDFDLGTPNQAFGGPGIGTGPFGNDTAQGKAVIIAEDIIDNNNDNLVDDPDDEGQGGYISFKFPAGVTVVPYRVVVLDIENTGTWVKGYTEGGSQVFAKTASPLGDNSLQNLDLSLITGPVNKFKVIFSTSGAVPLVTFCNPSTPTPSPTPSLTPSATASATPSVSASPSASASTSPSTTPSKSPSASKTPSPSMTPSASASSTPSKSPSASPSGTPAKSPSPSASKSPQPSASMTPQPSPSKSPSASPSKTPSKSPSSTPSKSPSKSPTASATPSASASVTPSVSPSIFVTPTPSASKSPSPSVSKSPSSSPSASASSTPQESPSKSPSKSPSASPSNSASRTPSPSTSASSTPSASASRTPSNSPSSTPSRTPSNTPSSSPSVTPSVSPSLFVTPTPSTSVSPSVSPSSVASSSPSSSPSSGASTTPSPSASSTPPECAEEVDECGVCGGEGKDICGKCPNEPGYGTPPDQCGFCDGESGYGSDICIGCNSLDITNTQLDIDAGVKGQEKRIKRVFKLVDKLFDPRPTPPWFGNKAEKKFLAKVFEAQDRAWRTTWSIPSVVSLCENPAPFCITSNENELAMEIYLELTDDLHRMAKQTWRKARAAVRIHPDKIADSDLLLRLVKRQAKRERKRWQDNRAGALSIPTVSVSCVGSRFKVKRGRPESAK